MFEILSCKIALHLPIIRDIRQEASIHLIEIVE